VTRNRVKYAQFRKLHMNTNPARGPFHQKSPALIIARTIRGMVNQKTARGQAALTRLSTFEGVPAPYDKQKRVVIPAALKVMRLKAGRDFTVLGDLSHSVGWKHQDLLKRLEAKRKVDAKEFFDKKKEGLAKKRAAEAACADQLVNVNKVLADAGY
jgi:large subunit ribosomal protein L13Ae